MREIAIFELPFRGRCEFGRLLDKPGMRTRRVDPKDYFRVFPQGAHLLIIPGSAKTTCDLEYLRTNGGEGIIRRHLGEGRPVVGICGGYQMLGGVLHDPHRRQGPLSCMAGMNLLPTVTVFGPRMMSCHTAATLIETGGRVFGEEHRSGTSLVVGKGCRQLHAAVRRKPLNKWPEAQMVQAGPWQRLHWQPGQEESDGIYSLDRKVWGTYIHRIFDNERFNELVFAHVGF